MKKIFQMKWAALLALIVVAAGCAKAPEAEIEQANQAIEAAKQAEAEIFVAEEFAALQDSMNVVMEQIELEKSNFFPNYSTTKNQLAAVVQLADTVKAQASVRKTEIKQEIETALAEIKLMLEDNRSLVAAAPKGKEGVMALEQINQEIAVIETSVSEISSNMETTNIMDAHTKVGSIKEKATSINTELKGVIEKYQQKNKKA